ncbi:putative transposase [Namao virus]|nr:putative transposase [Namao virus]
MIKSRLPAPRQRPDNYYQQRKLRLFGVPETPGENCYAKAVFICGSVLPYYRDQMRHFIEYAHRYGKNKFNNPRPIVIQFNVLYFCRSIMRNYRDNVYLKELNIRFANELSKSEIQMRRSLWPVITAARRQGKQAFFKGDAVIIDGKIFTMEDLMTPSNSKK